MWGEYVVRVGRAVGTWMEAYMVGTSMLHSHAEQLEFCCLSGQAILLSGLHLGADG